MREIKDENRNIVVSIKNNAMEAYLNLSEPKEDTYSYDQIVEVLRNHNVIHGINQEAIVRMIKERRYYIDVLVATGTPPKNGEHGFFEFFFEQASSSKPKILEDGSVDYYAMNRVIAVTVGDKLIEYHPAQPGVAGRDVTAKEIKATSGKDLPIIKGKGFTLSEDRRIYKAAITGKIDFKNDQLIISNILEIKGDVDLITGDIQFHGDVMIYGNVESGMRIEAGGSVIIRGHVEKSTIIAGKDIVFESGMQGAGKGLVISSGSIRGKFFEQVEMKAAKDISANAIMNCSIEAGGSVTITGKRGAIIGGSTTAIESITASMIGNAAGVKTKLYAGVPQSNATEIKLIDQKIEQRQQRLEQIMDGIEMIEERDTPGVKNPYEGQKLSLLRAKISINSEIAELQQEKNSLLDKLNRSRDSKIVAQKAIYPPSVITMNGASLIIEEPLAEVVFVLKGSEVQMQNL